METLRVLGNDPVGNCLRQRYWGPRPNGNPSHQWRPTNAPLVLLGLFEKVVSSGSTYQTALSILFHYLDSASNLELSCTLDVRHCHNRENIEGTLNVRVYAVVDFERPSNLRYPLLDWRRV